MVFSLGLCDMMQALCATLNDRSSIADVGNICTCY